MPVVFWFIISRTNTNTFCLGYIGEFEIVDDHRSGKIVVQLNGRLNKTGVISPRFNVQVTQLENWVNLLLPSRGFGFIILVSALSLFHTSLPNHLPHRPLLLVSLTTRRHEGSMLVAKFWAMYTEHVFFASSWNLGNRILLAITLLVLKLEFHSKSHHNGVLKLDPSFNHPQSLLLQ